MQDKKFRILCIIGIVWALLFLLTMKVKAPMLEGVEIAVTLAAIIWFFYWTLSMVRWAKKPEPTKESETSNASEKKADKQ